MESVNRNLYSVLLISILLSSSVLVLPSFAQYATKNTSSITLTLSPSKINFGEQTKITVQITPQSSSGSVIFQYSTEGSKWNDIAKVQPSKGIASQNWKPLSAGQYLVRAVWSGDERYTGSTSNTAQLTVQPQQVLPTQKELNLSLIASPTELNLGDKVAVTVNANPAIVATIILQYSIDQRSWIDVQRITTSSDGSAKTTWIPSVVGKLYLRTYFAGDKEYKSASSNVVIISVIEKPTAQPQPQKPLTLVLSISKTEIYVGDKIIIEVKTDPPFAGQILLQQGRVELDEDWNELAEIETSRDGYGETTWVPSAAGNIFLRAYYAGDKEHKTSISNIVKIIVKAPELQPVEALTAALESSLTSGNAPLSVVFTGKVTGGKAPYSWTIDYGDGTSESGTGSSISVKHTYKVAGTYRAIVTVKDSTGDSIASNRVRIEVNPVVPPVQPIKPVFALDKDKYMPGDTVFLKGTLSSSAKLTMVVFDADEDVYLAKDLQAGSDGRMSFSFQLAKDVEPGVWLVQITYGDSGERLKFEVGTIGVSVTARVGGEAAIKDLKKTTLISVKNTGDTPITSLSIKVDQGSITFVKGKNWERERIGDDTVTLTSDKGVDPKQTLIVLLKWKDKPELPKNMKVPINPTKGGPEVPPDVPCELICIVIPFIDLVTEPEIKVPKIDLKDGIIKPPSSLINLSVDSGDSFDPAIAISESNVYVVWSDNTPGNYDILFRKSTNNGDTFSAAVNPSEDSGDSFDPAIVVSEDNVYVVWVDKTPENSDILFRKSTDNGDTFGDIMNLSESSEDAFDPAIAISDDNVYVVWVNKTLGSHDILFRKSTDNGSTFDVIANLSEGSQNSFDPEIAIYEDNVYVVWRRATSAGWADILFRKSTNNGDTFSAAVNLSNNFGDSADPQIVISGSNMYVVWPDRNPGNYDILFRKSTNNGDTFGSTTNLSNNPGSSFDPEISISGSNMYLVWPDRTPGNLDIFFKRVTV